MDPYVFSLVPANLISIIVPFVLIVAGYLVEKNFVGRVATFTNAISVNLAFYNKNLLSLGPIYWLLIIYLDLGLIMGG